MCALLNETSAVSFTHARGHDSPREPSTLSAIKPDNLRPLAWQVLTWSRPGGEDWAEGSTNKGYPGDNKASQSTIPLTFPDPACAVKTEKDYIFDTVISNFILYE